MTDLGSVARAIYARFPIFDFGLVRPWSSLATGQREPYLSAARDIAKVRSRPVERARRWRAWAGFVDGRPHVWLERFFVYGTRERALLMYEDARLVEITEVRRPAARRRSK